MHMGKTLGVRKGAWTHEEDKLLRACIQKYGEGKWYLVPQRAGLNRCRKSCRLRWLNYLTPNINRRSFAEDEVDMILRLHKLLGNRWSLIAGRLPGRTANDVKNYWHTNLLSKVAPNKEYNNKVKEKPKETMQTHVVIRPRPRTFSKHSLWLRGKHIFANDDGARECATPLVVATDVSGPSECVTTPPVFTNDNGSTECATQMILPIGGGGVVGVGDCAGQTSLGTVPQSIQWWESLLNLDNQVGDEGNGTCSLINGQEGNSILEFSNVEELIPCQRSRLLEDCSWESNLGDFNSLLDL